MEEAEGDPYPEQANNWAHIGALWETGMGSQTLKRIRNTLHDLNFDIDQVTSISIVNIHNISCINNIRSDISQYYKVNIVPRTSNTNTTNI